jgi:FMN-dependent NADH-azoreductase
MSKLLHILASPRVESYSTRVAKAFLDSYRQARPEDPIEVLDLFRADIPPFYAPQAKAKYAVMAGETPRDEAEAAWQPVIKTINHFKGFDKYVLSSPMWNFGVPYRLKQYVDVIVQPGLTFAFSPEKGYTGLVTDRPLMLILARGGVYPTGNPCETFDFQETYLRAVFGYIGFTDIRAVRIQGTLQNKPDQVEADTRKAMAEAADAAMAFAGEVAMQV